MNVNQILIRLGVVMGLLNPVAALITQLENGKNSEPVLLALFVIPWFVGAELVRRRTIAGPVVIGLLSLFDVFSFPGWRRSSVADWSTELLALAGAITCLGLAVTVLVQRTRRLVVAGAVR